MQTKYLIYNFQLPIPFTLVVTVLKTVLRKQIFVVFVEVIIQHALIVKVRSEVAFLTVEPVVSF
jgi:hypothetical protein